MLFYIPSKLLKKTSKVVYDFNIYPILEEMNKEIKDKKDISISAPQVGWLQRIFMAKDKEGQVTIIVNPEVLLSEGEEEYEEECLSIPDMKFKVKRPKSLLLLCYTAMGNPFTLHLTGDKAARYQHEIDHLNGVLISDHGYLLP